MFIKKISFIDQNYWSCNRNSIIIALLLLLIPLINLSQGAKTQIIFDTLRYL